MSDLEHQNSVYSPNLRLRFANRSEGFFMGRVELAIWISTSRLHSSDGR